MHADQIAENLADRYGLDVETIRTEALKCAEASPDSFNAHLAHQRYEVAPIVLGARRICGECGQSVER